MFVIPFWEGQFNPLATRYTDQPVVDQTITQPDDGSIRGIPSPGPYWLASQLWNARRQLGLFRDYGDSQPSVLPVEPGRVPSPGPFWRAAGPWAANQQIRNWGSWEDTTSGVTPPVVTAGQVFTQDQHKYIHKSGFIRRRNQYPTDWP